MIKAEIEVYTPKERLPKEEEYVIASCYERKTQEDPELRIVHMSLNRWNEEEWYTMNGEWVAHVDWWTKLPMFCPLDVEEGRV